MHAVRSAAKNFFHPHTPQDSETNKAPHPMSRCFLWVLGGLCFGLHGRGLWGDVPSHPACICLLFVCGFFVCGVLGFGVKYLET